MRSRAAGLVPFVGCAFVFVLLLACKKKGAPGADAGGSAQTPPPSTVPVPAASVDSPAEAEISKRLVQKLRTAAGCPSPNGPNRVWCIVDGYATGTPAPLPARVSLVGLTIGMSEDFPGEQSLTNNVTLSAAAFKGEGAKMQGWISTIRPNAPSEQRDVAESVMSAGAFFKDKGPAITLAPTLLAYVKSLPDSASYPVTKGKLGWIISGRSTSDVRKVGAHWVAVEVPPAKPLRGVYISIFTDQFKPR